jgi:hypothetical protein
MRVKNPDVVIVGAGMAGRRSPQFWLEVAWRFCYLNGSTATVTACAVNTCSHGACWKRELSDSRPRCALRMPLTYAASRAMTNWLHHLPSNGKDRQLNRPSRRAPSRRVSSGRMPGTCRRGGAAGRGTGARCQRRAR